MSVVCSIAHAENEDHLKDRKLSNQLAEYAANNEPGVQYVVVDKTSTIFSHSVGLLDIDKNIALNAGNTMAAFSMTKTLTAIAILQLVERNKIKLSDRVSEFVENPYNTNITIRHLLNHTSGIPNPIPLQWVHLAQNHVEFDEQAAFEEVLDKYPDLDSKPGEKYKYSNIGYWMLGGIIEKVTGKRYTEYVKQNIFQSLNLNSNEIGFQTHNENNHAKGYLKKWSFMGLFGRFFVDSAVLGKNEKGWLHIKNVYVNGPSFGGAIGSATAFLKILQDLLSDNSKLLKSQTKQLLYQRQSLNSGKEIDMTLGWNIGELNGVTYYYKEGGGAGFHCEMRIYPENGLASVIMANKTTFNSKKILSELDMNFLAN